MNIELNPVDRKDLEELARAEGKAVGALLLELVHEALSARKRIGEVQGDDAKVIRRQQEELHEKLDALPCEGAQDGFSGRDHDKVLYGGPMHPAGRRCRTPRLPWTDFRLSGNASSTMRQGVREASAV